MEIQTQDKKNIMKAVLIFSAIISVYFLAKIATEIKQYALLGSGVAATNVISFSGSGEVFAIPDIANISFTVRHDAKTVKSATDMVSVDKKKALDFLKKSGVEEKDIKTISYNSYPKYEYQNGPEIACLSINCPRPGKQVLVGYEVSESVSVKIRDTEKAGVVIDGISALGISELSGPDFAIDNEDKLKEEARAKAISDAKAKAEILAKDLGVKLVRIVNFSESGNYPMMYKSMEVSIDSMGGGSAPSTELSKGEQKITSNVTITYEIR